jgi:hypothetical protein
MALSIAKVAGADHVEGNKKVKVRTITFDNSYPTGGESLTPNDVGLKTIDTVQGGVAPATSGGATARTVAYDHTNQKLLVYTTASAEAANASDQSAFSIRLRFVGS